MLFAAGKGTRLQPFTHTQPKSLAKAGQATLLEHNIRFFKQAGIDTLVINIHHYGQQIIDFLNERDFGIDIHFSKEQTLLETGGGLYHAKDHFLEEELFVVCNSDIYTTIDLQQMLAVHRQAKHLATLAVADRQTSRYLRFNEQSLLCGWEDRRSGEELSWNNDPYTTRAFNGLQVLSPGIFKYMENMGEVFSIIPVYLKAARAGEIIKGHDTGDAYWIDIGTPEKLEALKAYLKR